MISKEQIPVEAIRVAKEALEEQVEALIEIGAIWSIDRANRFARKVKEIETWLKDIN